MTRYWLTILLLTTAPLQAGELVRTLPAAVLKVVDGDTIKVGLELLDDTTKTTGIRLAGIDTPELKARCLSEKIRAHWSKQLVASLVGERVWVIDPRDGKFAGRLVARVVTAEGVDLGQALLDAELAREYDGKGKREGWC